MSYFPPYVSRQLIQERLQLVFPPGTQNRSYVVREMSASVVFTLLYIGAIEGADVYLAPIHVYRMTEEQAALEGEGHRLKYRSAPLKKGFVPLGRRWYADNTREPIRDETLREGFMPLGVVLAVQGIPTTSSKPRYYLQGDFAALFDPALAGQELDHAISEWQQKCLTKSALTRISLANLGQQDDNIDVLVTFPNRETRRLANGPSSIISKAVIETFAPQFLKNPVVLWLSTSDNKVVTRDDEVAAKIGLKIQADKNLPDIILVDLAPAHPLLVFVEVVATDGAITDRRQAAIYEITDNAGFERSQVTFVTAYIDRSASGFTKTIKGLAWNSFLWFVSEPDKLIILKDGVLYLSDLK